MASARLRFGVGLILLGAYATKRFSCMQRLAPGSVHLTRDAVVAGSHKQKTARYRTSPAAQQLFFCAPRLGISRSASGDQPVDWGGEWFAARAEYADALGWTSFDEADFLVPEKVSSGIVHASKHFARALFRDSLRAAGIEDDELTWGSMRPFLNTTGAQTRQRKEDRATLGTWSATSNSTDVYDRALGTKELLVRDSCLRFHRDGGELGAAFEFPRPPAKRARDASADSD